MFANFAYIVDSIKCPTDIFYSCIYPSSRAVLTNKRNFFTGLLFEVEQASRGLSAIAELLVRLCDDIKCRPHIRYKYHNISNDAE